jgi:hypothetical protein
MRISIGTREYDVGDLIIQLSVELVVHEAQIRALTQLSDRKRLTLKLLKNIDKSSDE